jgi:hypothetical protein
LKAVIEQLIEAVIGKVILQSAGYVEGPLTLQAGDTTAHSAVPVLHGASRCRRRFFGGMGRRGAHARGGENPIGARGGEGARNHNEPEPLPPPTTSGAWGGSGGEVANMVVAARGAPGTGPLIPRNCNGNDFWLRANSTMRGNRRNAWEMKV